MKKILISGDLFKYWSMKLSHIKGLCFTDNFTDKDVEIIVGHENDILAFDLTVYRKLKWIQLLSAGIGCNLRNKIFSKYIVTTSKGIHEQSMFEYILQGLLCLKNGSTFEKKKLKSWKRIRRNLVLESNQNILLLGAGNIGSYLAKQFSVLGMNVDALVTSLRKTKHINEVFSSIKKIRLSKYSIIVSTLPLTNKTKNIVNRFFFNSMSKNAIFINIGRGGTVDERSLYGALKKKKIGGAILDTFLLEPIKKKNFLFYNLDNCLCSPHVSGYFNGSYNLLLSKFEKLFRLYKVNKLKSEVNKDY